MQWIFLSEVTDMNIPRQFYGVNYLSRLYDNFQDSDLTDCKPIPYRLLTDIVEQPLRQERAGKLGMSAGFLSELLCRLATNRACDLDGLGIARNGQKVFSAYRTPYASSYPRITNSTCKTVTAIAVMFAVAEQRMCEEDTVLSFFPEYESLTTPKVVKEMTVYHLLTMTSCSKCNEIVSVTEMDWVKAFLLSDCQEPPGSKFIYNSMNTYMLAAIVTKVTGMSLLTYLKPRLFAPLGINHVKWELCPCGIERGGWGLHITLDDMLKLGIFLTNDGNYAGKQLLHPSYIRKMKQHHVSQEVDKLSVGYGYQLWHLPHGLYMLSGMYGQHVIIDDERHTVIATNAHNDKMFPDSLLTREIIKALSNSELYAVASYMEEYRKERRLQQEVEAFSKGYDLQILHNGVPYTFFVRKQQLLARNKTQQLKQQLLAFHKKRLHIDHGAFKLFPYMLQGMYQCPPFLVTDLVWKLDAGNDKVHICFYKERGKKVGHREKLVLHAGLYQYCYQRIAMGQSEWNLAGRMYSAVDEDGHTVLFLELVFPDVGFSRILKFFLLEERIAIECLEYPDMRGILEQVLFGETVLAGNRIDLTDKLPQSLRVLLENKVEPRMYGYLQ